MAAAAAAAAVPVRLARAQARPVRIGFAISETGAYSVGAGITQIPNYILWRDQVNARGGLLVAGEGRRPVEFVRYDDRSEIETGIRLYERLATVDRVDLILPPWGTAMNFAVAPVVSEHEYPMIAPTLSSMQLQDFRLPYVYAILAQPDAQMRALAGLLEYVREQNGYNRVAVLHVADLFGVEHYNELVPRLQSAGFEIVLDRSYPLGVSDLSDVLRGARSSGADIVIGLSYPPDTNLIVNQLSSIGFNPPVLYTAVGTAFPAFRDNFGANSEGVMGVGAWNPKVPYPGAREYFEAHVSHLDREPDRWASASAYASLQILEQAVAEVGLDRRRIKEYIDSNEFQTVIGPVRFVDGVNVVTPGMVGQWQNGEFEVIWPREHATAEPLVPKPAWR
ncbi:MAG: amino acid ABC transporter substrate-binding protein [Firmicutes bacterium]|nr:amino acid ABC transporter substrate-binding protein [Bacillota bacterium]